MSTPTFPVARTNTIAHGKIVDFDKGPQEALAIISVKVILDPHGEWARYHDRDDWVEVSVSELSRATEPLRVRLRDVASVKRPPRLGAKLPRSEEMRELLSPEPGENLTRGQQIVLLRSGVNNWNRWYVKATREADLQFADLQGADLQFADLRSADLQEADLRGADLQFANLRGADLRWADLQGTDLGEVSLENARYNNYTDFPRGFDPMR